MYARSRVVAYKQYVYYFWNVSRGLGGIKMTVEELRKAMLYATGVHIVNC